MSAARPSTSEIDTSPLWKAVSGQRLWPEVLNDLYNHFLNSQNALVKLCFKRMGIYSFGGFGSSADTEGNAATFDNDGGDMNFDSPADIKEDGLNNYLMIPITRRK